MNIFQINIYINRFIWNCFKPEDHIDIYIDRSYFSSIEEFQHGKIFKRGDDVWKIITIPIDPEFFKEMTEIKYNLYTETMKRYNVFGGTVRLDESFINEDSLKVFCLSNPLDFFAEFVSLPSKWDKSNHKYWYKSFQKEVFQILLLCKRKNFYKDVAFLIIDSLAKLYLLD